MFAEKATKVAYADPGGLGDRQRGWADPSGRRERGGSTPPLPGHRTGSATRLGKPVQVQVE